VVEEALPGAFERTDGHTHGHVGRWCDISTGIAVAAAIYANLELDIASCAGGNTLGVCIAWAVTSRIH
jgi:hypothetical protein